MDLSHIIRTKVHELKKLVPDNLFSSLRAARRFMYEIDPVSYYVAWIGTFWRGIYGLGMFVVASSFVKKGWDGAFEEYLKPEHLTVGIMALTITAIALWQMIRSSIGVISNWRDRMIHEKTDLRIEQEETDLLASLDVGRLTDPEFIRLRELVGDNHGPDYRSRLFHNQLSFASETFGLIASLGLLMILDPVFILLAMLPIAFEVIKDIKEDSNRRELRDSLHLLRRKKAVYHECLTHVMPLLQGRLFNFAEYWRERYYFLRNEKWNADMANYRTELRWEIGMSFVRVVPLLLTFSYLGHSLAIGAIALPGVLLLWGSMTTFGSALSGISSVLTDIRSECIDYGYREQFLATKPLIDERDAEHIRFASTPRLELRNVSFRYPRQEAFALNDCSLTIAPGEKVALVGENGSGKTTLLRLLSKTYLPSEGVVTIDNLPTSRITQSSWFGQMLYATQENGVPEFTIEEAVTGTSPEAIDRARLEKAAGHSRAASVIAGLPDGYSTQIGGDWWSGWEPSAGQRQRIKVTAAFYRLLTPGVHIGFFDEPMSQCDVETRERFYRDLQGLRDKTIVVVAHDPVYLHYFQRVILMENGRVVRDMRTKEDIAAYQRDAIPQFEDHERESLMRIVE